MYKSLRTVILETLAEPKTVPERTKELKGFPEHALRTLLNTNERKAQAGDKGAEVTVAAIKNLLKEERQYPKEVEDKAKEIADAMIRDKPEMKSDKEKVMRIAWATAKRHFGLD